MNLISDSDSAGQKQLTQNNNNAKDSSDVTPRSSFLGSAMRLLPKTAQVLDRGSQVTNSNYKYGFKQYRSADDRDQTTEQEGQSCDSSSVKPDFPIVRTISQLDEMN